MKGLILNVIYPVNVATAMLGNNLAQPKQFIIFKITHCMDPDIQNDCHLYHNV